MNDKKNDDKYIKRMDYKTLSTGGPVEFSGFAKETFKVRDVKDLSSVSIDVQGDQPFTLKPLDESGSMKLPVTQEQRDEMLKALIAVHSYAWSRTKGYYSEVLAPMQEALVESGMEPKDAVEGAVKLVNIYEDMRQKEKVKGHPVFGGLETKLDAETARKFGVKVSDELFEKLKTLYNKLADGKKDANKND
ncbi:hypothetical protein KY330_03730 [Candidatus Woesearchaeota archaeon]|nr:hypothetical protein [Candidatus Woesearchaeota archaeon]